jgi:hypothetical protein
MGMVQTLTGNRRMLVDKTVPAFTLADLSEVVMSEFIAEKIAETRKFADSLGPNARKSLEDNLNYLVTYAARDGIKRTQLYLYSDLAPHSFGFVLHWLARSFYAQAYKCRGCNSTYSFEAIPVIRPCPLCNGELHEVEGERTECKVADKEFMHGALVYFAANHTGVGWPQYSVSLCDDKTARWEVHT